MKPQEIKHFQKTFLAYFPALAEEIKSPAWQRMFERTPYDQAAICLETVFQGGGGGMTLAAFSASLPKPKPAFDPAAYAAKNQQIRDEDEEQNRALRGCGREELIILAKQSATMFPRVYGWMTGYFDGKPMAFGIFGPQVDPSKESAKCGLIERIIRDAAFSAATGFAPSGV